MMSWGIADAVSRGESANVEAALVKELGTRFEGDLVEKIRELVPLVARQKSDTRLQAFLATSLLQMPSFTLRGGTNEVLKGIICRELGLR